MKIGVFDSGIGGKTVLAAIQTVLPDAEYKYIADSKNCPYGEKSEAELFEIVCKNVDELAAWGAKIIVIACNTATTRCIDGLRQKYPTLKFVGTEPAIKLACESGGKDILVMATPGTIQSDRVQALVAKNQKPEQEITLLPCAGLADVIEFNGDVEAKLDELLADLSKEFDRVVLGCTHYSLIRDKIQKRFASARLIDGNAGIAKRVLEVLK